MPYSLIYKTLFYAVTLYGFCTLDTYNPIIITMTICNTFLKLSSCDIGVWYMLMSETSYFHQTISCL